MMKTVVKFGAIFLCILSIATTVSHTASAQSSREEREERELKKGKWKNFNSITQIFSTKFPVKYKYKVYPFQFNEHSVAFSTEILSSLNGLLDAKSNEKSILIKAQHTFGPELTIQDVQKILRRESQKYQLAARSMGGQLLSDEDFTHEGDFPGKKFYISYKSNSGETYGLRIQVIMTNYAKIEQVLSGPANSIYSFRSNDFLESIKLNDGRYLEKNPDNAVPRGTGWIPHTSTNKIFTVKLPPQNKDYVPHPPEFTARPNVESIFLEISDPVIFKSAFYRATAYKLDKPVNIKIAKRYIISKHVSNFVRNASPNSLLVDHYLDKDTGINTLKSKLVITPIKKYPYVTNIFYDARYIGNFLVIQEFLSSRDHSKSGLNETLFSLLDFHPKKYTPVKAAVKVQKNGEANKSKK